MGRAPLSPRRRRLRWTLAWLVALVVVGSGLAWWAYERSRPSPYRPDETPDDITSELERALPREAPRPAITDVTRQAGLDAFRNFAGDRTSQLPEDMGPGVAWGDFDNDGDDDLFLVSAGGPLNAAPERLAPCALFENLGDGSFRPVPGFPETRIRGMGAAWGDADGDGFLDLVVTGYNALRFFRNENGTGRFAEDPRIPDQPGFWSGAAWGDFDNDRRLDLHLASYVRFAENDADRDRISEQIGTAVPFTLNPASYPGGLNALFRQGADGRFADAAAALKVQNPEGRSLGGLWHDFDGDGWLDLYVANDVSDNVLFRNVAGRFEDLSHPAWVADYRSAMGLAAGDVDRDGDDELFITHWVAQENALYDNTWANFNLRAQARSGSAPPDAAAGRTYPLRFVDVADQKGLGQIALPYVGWGTEFVDLDQDGWLDLLVANGSTLEVADSRPRRLDPQESFLFWNQRGEHFHNLAPLHPGLAGKHVSRGLACADFDNDGDMDWVVADLYEGVRLYRNDMAAGHWLKVRLRSRNADGVPNGFGDGSTVIAWLGDVPLRRSVTGVSYLSQSSRVLHWGLGAVARVDRLEVRWHAGGTNVFEGLEADATYELVEGESAPRRVGGRPAAGAGGTRPPDGRSPAPAGSALGAGDRERLVRFWNTQRAAMNALKVDGDRARAIRLFREAIDLDPTHEDARYYLGLCLAGEGDVDGALAALAGLQALNPQSHRAWQQWGVIRAQSARTDADLQAAQEALERAHRLNPEETGALLLLAEVALLRGDLQRAESQLTAATQTNPKAVGGFFLRGYLAWKGGDAEGARRLLALARAALGPEWKPRGATSEGDVRRTQHVEAAPLAAYWQNWDGQGDPATAYAELEAHLARTASGNVR